MQSTLFSIGNSTKAENFIYTDASADWKKTVNGRGTGLICIQINEEAPIVEKIELNFPGLKQLINRFELLAIERAKEIAIIEKGLNNIQIFSDSKVAVGWSKDTKVSWVPREKNKAGIYLEKERKNLVKKIKFTRCFKKNEIK
jgi:ribonuclease HI